MEIKKVDIYSNSTTKKLSIGSGCVIIENEKVLLVRGKGGTHFKFPGGHIEDTENLKESAERETMEETGLRVEAVGDPLFFLFEFDENTDIILIHYLASILEGDPEPNTEIEEVGWFEIDNLPEKTFDNVEVILAKFRSSAV